MRSGCAHSPGSRASPRNKVIDHIDEICRRFVALSPFVASFGAKQDYRANQKAAAVNE
jgi:hypothetical protein